MEATHAERRLAFYTRIVGKDTETASLPREVPLVRYDDDAQYYEVSRSPAETEQSHRDPSHFEISPFGASLNLLLHTAQLKCFINLSPQMQAQPICLAGLPTIKA